MKKSNRLKDTAALAVREVNESLEATQTEKHVSSSRKHSSRIKKHVSTNQTPGIDTAPIIEAVTVSSYNQAARPRVSFYLTQGTIDDLDKAVHELKGIAKSAGLRPTRVTKTMIVEAALLAALQDMDKQGAESMLGRLVADLAEQ